MSINSIRKEVEKINNGSGYSNKKLDNDYFVDKKNEATDGGQELRGLYKNGQIKKINYSVGISCCMNTSEFYFSDNKLIFVFEKQEIYPEVKGDLGESKIEYTKLETVFEGRYYFGNSKILKTNIKGRKRFSSDLKYNKSKSLLKEATGFLAELRSAQSH